MLPALVTGAVAAASFLVVGGLIGIRAGLHFGDALGGVASAIPRNAGRRSVDGRRQNPDDATDGESDPGPGPAPGLLLSPVWSVELWAAMSLEMALLAPQRHSSPACSGGPAFAPCVQRAHNTGRYWSSSHVVTCAR